MRSPKVFFSPDEYQEFKSLGPARRVFTRAALAQEQVAFVREDELVFRVTINNVRLNSVIEHVFGNYKQVENCIKGAFPCYLN